MAFKGWPAEAIEFYEGLEADNTRAYWQDHKQEYDEFVKAPMVELLAELAGQFGEGKIFRPFRDVRFSKDKSPYKTHLGASFPWVGGPEAHVPADGSHDARTHGNGGYFHFQPGEMYVGGGMWQMERPTLEAFRALVRDDPDRVRAALEEPGFAKAWGEARAHDELRRFPPGWPQDHPLARLFLWKNVVFGRRLSDAEALSPELPDRLAEAYAAATPVLRFLASLP